MKELTGTLDLQAGLNEKARVLLSRERVAFEPASREDTPPVEIGTRAAVVSRFT